MTKSRLLKTFLLFLLTSALAGCAAKGFNRGELKEQLSVLSPTYDDKEIQAAYEKKQNLPKPFKLAVYFKQPKTTGFQGPVWRWTDQDRELIESVTKTLKDQGIAADVFPIISTLVENESLKSLRMVAAKHQADALLIITGAGQIDRYINNWGWSYILILPTFFVPGSVANTLFISSASLWDVKNEYLYLTAETESTISTTYIPIFGDRDVVLLDHAKSETLEKLKVEINKMLNGTKFH